MKLVFVCTEPAQLLVLERARFKSTNQIAETMFTISREKISTVENYRNNKKTMHHSMRMHKLCPQFFEKTPGENCMTGSGQKPSLICRTPIYVATRKFFPQNKRA